MMRILILGAQGQVGRALVSRLGAIDQIEIDALGREQLDLTDAAALQANVARRSPDVVINAAAYTAVDRAESEPELAHAVNAVAPGVLASAASECKALFIHYSTDYVFNGEARSPYTEDAPVAPLNVYGRSKLAGERAVMERAPGRHIVLRTSWVYAAEGRNFLNTMLRLAAERETLRVVDDQHGAPTWAGSLAAATVGLVERYRAGRWSPGDAGVYHAACGGETTWCGFARRIMALAGAESVTVEGITTEAFPTPAKRPRYSVLDCSRLQERFAIAMPHWESALDACWQERVDAFSG